jgi:hypothetical protein
VIWRAIVVHTRSISSLGDVVPAHEVARGICSVDLKTVCRAAVGRPQADIVKHSSGVQHLRIELEAPSSSREWLRSSKPDWSG